MSPKKISEPVTNVAVPVFLKKEFESMKGRHRYMSWSAFVRAAVRVLLDLELERSRQKGK